MLRVFSLVLIVRHAAATTCASVNGCDAGKYCFPPLGCIACAEGTFKVTNASDSACLTCTKGYQCLDSGMGAPDKPLVPCPAGKYDAVGGIGTENTDTKCEVCAEGKRSGNTTFVSSGATFCQDCPAGFAGVMKKAGNKELGTSWKCTACNPSEGNFQPLPAQGACQTCPIFTSIVVTGLPDTAPEAQRCLACPKGKFQPKVIPKNEKGEGGGFVTGPGQLDAWRGLSCAQKKAANPKMGSCYDLATNLGPSPEMNPVYALGQCYDCPEGRWQNTLGASICQDCAKGKFHPGVSGGATSAAACTSEHCTKGYFCDNSKGFLQSNIGKSVCTSSKCNSPNPPAKIQPCPSGRYGASSGLMSASSCTGCSAGKFGIGTGKTADSQCGLCGKGTYSAIVGNDMCTSYGSLSSSCTSKKDCDGKCPTGRYGTQSGITAASQCDGECSAGRFGTGTGYSKNDQCQGRCSLGRFSNRTALTTNSDCPLCHVGRFTDAIARTVCAHCPIARYRNTTGATVCESCHRGEFSKQQGSTGCDKCEPGRYSADRDIRVFCLECFGGRWSNFSGASALSECTRLQCPVFAPRDRMSITYTNNRTLPSKAKLHLEHGYEESFAATILCVWSGIPPDQVAWGGLDKNGDLPAAIGVQCDVLNAPGSGSVNFTNDRRFPSIAEFRCDRGYVLTTEAGLFDGHIFPIHCTRDRVWNTTSPTCTRITCLQVKELLATANESKSQVSIYPVLGDDIIYPVGWDTTLCDGTPPQKETCNSTADWAYTDQVNFVCPELGVMPSPFSTSLCTKSGVWVPDPRQVACKAVPCENLIAPPGLPPLPSAMIVWAKREGVRTASKHWSALAATSVIDFECTANAILYVNNNASFKRCRECDLETIPKENWQASSGSDVCCSIRVTCTPPKPEGDSPYGSLGLIAAPGINPDVPDDPYYRSLECRCQKGYINTEDTRRAKCVLCDDGTYTPLLHGVRRVECRACPREGVSCTRGVLKIKEDWWYDVERYDAMPPITKGVGPSTEFYKCPHRDACLVATELDPQKMYCTENHTGIMCSKCYHRRAACGRGGRGRPDSCIPPRYLDRGTDWMFFAVIARRCTRCPAGEQAILPLIITIVVAIAALIVIALIIVLQLSDVEHQIRQLAHGNPDHNAIGPLARLLINWLQATALLSTIKLTPPEAVRDVSIYADYAQGISTDWYAIACTIRLNIWSTFGWNLMQPILAALIPALIVVSTPPVRRTLQSCMRSTKRACRKFCKCKSDDDADDAATEDLLNPKNENRSGADSVVVSDAACVGAPGSETVEASHTSIAVAPPPVPPPRIASRGDKRQMMPRTFDARFGYWSNQSGKKVALREQPKHDAPLTGFALFADDTVRAEKIDNDFLYLTGTWGAGWVPQMSLGGVRIMHRLAAGLVYTPREYEALALSPSHVGGSEILPAGPLGALEEQVRHRYRALLALCPESGINRDVMELIFPLTITLWEIDEFLGEYDHDGDGVLSFEEYASADPEILKRWRFGKAWRIFSEADLDGDGILNHAEILPLLPMTVQETDVERWIRRFDKAGSHGGLTIVDYPAFEKVTRKDDVRTIVMAAFSMSVFLVYIRTTKSIMMMFSTQKIEGVAYLKRDIGEKAYTDKHLGAIAVASVYGFVFVLGVPVAAVYILHINRHKLENRNIQAAFGFLFQGYRKKMFFWEFAVLLRKVCFLAVALFWEDAFLQSIVGLFVIIASIVIHMACWPYEHAYLNIVELMSLISLFSLVSLSLLLWYIQSPGHDTYLVLYELSVTWILFTEYFTIGTLLVGRYVHIVVRETSLKLVSLFPSARYLLLWCVRAEAWVHFQLNDGEDLTPMQPELWTFLRPDEEEEEKRKLRAAQTKERLHKLGRAASRVFSPLATALIQSNEGGGDGNGVADTLSLTHDWWTARRITLGSLWEHPKRGVGTIVALSPNDDSRVHVEFVRSDGTGVDIHRYYFKSWHKLKPFVKTSAAAVSKPTSVRNPLDVLRREAAAAAAAAVAAAEVAAAAEDEDEGGAIASKTVTAIEAAADSITI